MQNQIMTALEDRLESDGFIVFNEVSFSNAGIIRAVPEGQWTSRYPMHYSFQKTYCSFKYHQENREQPIKIEVNIGIDYNRGEANFVEKLEKIIEFLEGKWGTQ